MKWWDEGGENGVGREKGERNRIFLTMAMAFEVPLEMGKNLNSGNLRSGSSVIRFSR